MLKVMLNHQKLVTDTYLGTIHIFREKRLKKFAAIIAAGHEAFESTIKASWLVLQKRRCGDCQKLERPRRPSPVAILCQPLASVDTHPIASSRRLRPAVSILKGLTRCTCISRLGVFIDFFIVW